MLHLIASWALKAARPRICRQFLAPLISTRYPPIFYLRLVSDFCTILENELKFSSEDYYLKMMVPSRGGVLR